MKIHCSGGKGELEHEACLACALSARGGQPCGYDYALLKAIFAGSQKEARRKEIHVTDLAGCLYRAYLDKTRHPAEYVHEILARWLGSAVHAHVEGSDEYLDSELPLAVDGLVGTADVVYQDGRVVDTKTTRWLYVHKLPYGSHELQLNLYAWMLRRLGRAVTRLQIQYIDLSGPTKCRKKGCGVPVRMFDGELRCPSCFGYVPGAHLGAALVEVPIWPEEDVERLVAERKNALEEALVFGRPPEREPGFLCAYCAHREYCSIETIPSEE